MADSKKHKAVYMIVESEGREPKWIRVGIAFTNRDESLTVRLDALPTNGRLQIRDFEDQEPEKPKAA